MSDAIILPNPDSMIHKAFAESGKLMDTTINWLKHRNPYPFDARIEYLESTGTQWIDSGITITALNIRMEFDAYSSSSSDSPFFDNNGFKCGVYGGNNWGNSLNAVFLSKYAYFRCGFAGTTEGRIDLERNRAIANHIIFDSSANYFAVDSTSGTMPSMEFPKGPDRRIFIYGANDSTGAVARPGKAKLYGFKIWKAGTLVRDFIPVRAGSVGYLYDKVSGQLFANAGAGSFVLGPDL